MPLSETAMDLLRSINISGEFVFSVTGQKPFRGVHRPKKRLMDAVGPEPWGLHDLRRTAATGMAEAGITPWVIERVLNHSQKGVAGTYNRYAADPEKRAALELWATKLRLIVENREDENILAFRNGAEVPVNA